MEKIRQLPTIQSQQMNWVWGALLMTVPTASLDATDQTKAKHACGSKNSETAGSPLVP